MPTPRPRVAFPWRCPACNRPSTRWASPFLLTTPSRTNRQQSTASIHPSISSQLPPTSPNYIDIPQPPQRQKPARPIIKGILPVPRDIFHRRRRGTTEITHQSLSAQIPDRKRPRVANTPEDARLSAHKAAQTASRKRNLREGLLALQARRVAAHRQRAARSQARLAARAEIESRPPTDAEQFTAPSVTAALRPAHHPHGILPNPDGPARLMEKRERHAAREAARAADTQDTLHTLYMQARDFILTEEALDNEIEKQFGTDAAPRTFAGGQSVWDYTRGPLTVSEMWDQMERRRGNNTAAARMPRKKAEQQTQVEEEATTNLMKRRLQKVAEELTGGKM